MERNANGEGSIIKDKRGFWRGAISLPSSNGKHKKKYIYGKTRKDVSDKMNDIINQLRTNTYVEPCKITLYEWLCTWLDQYCKNEVRLSTYVNYDTYVQRHIRNTIGEYKLCDLNTAIMQAFFNDKAKKGKLNGSGGLSPKTIKNMHDMMHRALDKAVHLDMIIKNPTDYVALPKRKKTEMRYLTTEEQSNLQDAIKGERLEMPILLALYTGMRQGELFGLQWSYVHLESKDRSWLRVVQAVNRFSDRTNESEKKTFLALSEPKTPHSVRAIPLLPYIAERLRQYKEEQEEYFKEKGLPMTNMVFTTKAGNLVDPRDFQRDFKLLLKRYNLREINVHALRHTFATRALESGMNVKTLSKILGHSSVAFTLDTYAHVTEDLKFEEMAAMNSFL
ncbi:site-specific integrase [Ruminococcus flavefaciens]|uniref:tyrosine-type recombinase/integrase n=1 Tax=Ruminococcus flavefaciens TaxID=1265 RepID=UPI0026F27807|nr:site-specific integrase [Ruminococcus flavefaciens]